MTDSAAQSWYEPLNQRESQILSLISEGYSNREIAHQLSLSLDTIKWYNKQLYSKLGVSSRTQASAAAREHRLLVAQSPAPVEEKALPEHNLPQIPTSFIGRQHEIAEIKQLLQKFRLVVLTGAGGSGKTRLALQVAAQLAGNFPDGAWLVELAPLSEPEMVPNAIADTLGVSQRGETALLEKIVHFLRPRRLLLVLDNFEHLLPAAQLVGALIASAPQIKIMATSRERLNVYGEQEYPVQPLGFPDMEQTISAEQLRQYESASLFLDRAKAVKQDFLLHPGETTALARICVHLDGLPLALELAASRVKLFSLTALEARLSNRLSLLTGGARNLPERQRTLRDTIDWSYNLLKGGERRLFARLAVFRGGATLEAVERICGQNLPPDLLPTLSSLVDKSLVQAHEGIDGEMRFGMLETIREYALERLASESDSPGINNLHGAYFASLAETAAAEIRGRNQKYWFARLHSEYDNLRTALTWSLNSDEIDSGLRLAAALRDYWYYTGASTEHQFWTDLALKRMQDAPPALQAGVLVSASLLGVMRKDGGKGEGLLQRAVDLYLQQGDVGNATWAKMFLSAQPRTEEPGYDQRVSLCQESLEVFRRTGDLAGQAQTLNILGEYARVNLDLEAAEDYYQQCLEIVAQTGERMREGILYVNLGFIAYHQGRYRKALQLMRDFLRIMEDFKIDYGLMTAIASMSGPLAALGQPERAARLLAAAEAQLEAKGSSHQSTDTPEIEVYRRAILEQLGEAPFRAAWEEGSHMTLQQMLDLAKESPLSSG
jgi:predicted ATPase/DNA-binding CsgD family transcriptional regulator